MIRQHLFQGVKPGSQEHLEKFLLEQKHNREKAQNPSLFMLVTSSFLVGCLVTLLVTVPL